MREISKINVLIGLLALILWSCKTVPIISNFSSSAVSVASGSPVTLAWTVLNATSVSISPDIGSVSGSSIMVKPTTTTEYTLTASNGDGVSIAKTTVTVTALILEATNFRVAKAGVDKVDLLWDAATGLSGYILERRINTEAYAKVADIAATATAYTDGSLTKNTTYSYRLRAVREGNPSVGVELRVGTASDNAVELADNTHVMDSSSREAVKSFDATTGNLSFAKLTPQVANLKPGDIVVSEPSPNAPNGYLRKVKAARPDGTGLILETEGAALAETIKQGSFNASQAVSDPNTYTEEPLVPGASLRRKGTSNTRAKEDCQKNGAGGLVVDIPNVKILEKTDQNPDGSIKVIGKITANGCIRIDPSIFLKGEVGFLLDLKSVEAGLNFDQEAQLKINLEGSVVFKKSIDVLKLRGPTITIWVGPIPIVIQPAFTLSVGATGKFEIKATFGFKEESSLRIGVQYTKASGWGLINESQSNWTPISPADKGNIKLKFSLEAFASAEPGLTFYGTINTSLLVQAYVKLDWEVPRNPLWKFETGLRFGFKADLSPVFKDAKLEFLTPDIVVFKTQTKRPCTKSAWV